MTFYVGHYLLPSRLIAFARCPAHAALTGLMLQPLAAALTPRCLIKHRLVRNDQHQLLSSALGDLGKAVLAEQNPSAPAPSPPVC